MQYRVQSSYMHNINGIKHYTKVFFLYEQGLK